MEPRSGSGCSGLSGLSIGKRTENTAYGRSLCCGWPWRLPWQASQASRGFIVYIARKSDGDYQPFGDMIQSPAIEIEVPDHDTYWYRVQAVYADGAVSALSEPIGVGRPEEKTQ